MFDAFAQQDGSFVGEPAAQPNDSRVSTAWRLRLAGWLQQPGVPVVVALVEGVALLGFFCFAPWFFWQANIDIPARISPGGDKYLLFIDSDHLSSGWA